MVRPSHTQTNLVQNGAEVDFAQTEAGYYRVEQAKTFLLQTKHHEDGDRLLFTSRSYTNEPRADGKSAMHCKPSLKH